MYCSLYRISGDLEVRLHISLLEFYELLSRVSRTYDQRCRRARNSKGSGREWASPSRRNTSLNAGDDVESKENKIKPENVTKEKGKERFFYNRN